MCGITAVINKLGVSINELEQMNSLISHRGPDDEGFCLFNSNRKIACHLHGNDSHASIKEAFPSLHSIAEKPYQVALGHRRLSIVDLSDDGHQPMTSHDGRFVIVFNGEVYNYKNIRKTLTANGIRFTSETDTEVIVNAWSFWGEQSLDMLEGMFAFIIYDITDNKLFAVRDRFGIKPLYYFQYKQQLYFASEIKQFTAVKGWRAEQNLQMVYDFLNWSMIDHTRETLFKNVYQLRPGEKLIVSLNNELPAIQRHKWYRLSIKDSYNSYENEVSQYQKLFENSVKQHLNADVPVGSCLSGGIDSSSIVGVVNSLKTSQQSQTTFSALSTDSSVDESRWIKEVLKKYSINAYHVTPEYEMLKDTLNELTYFQDEPFCSTSPFAQWCVFKLAKEHDITVMLDGQGADEQLGGYASYWGIVLAEKLKQGHFRQFLIEYNCIKRNSGLSHVALLKRVVNPFVNGRFSNLIRTLFTDSYDMPFWLDLDDTGISKRDPFLLFNARTASFQEFSLVQTQTINLQSLLHLEDRNSMAHSIEARVPFLDHVLVEKSLSLPTAYKFSKGVSKRILRDAMKAYLPEAIYNRTDKIGFATSEALWAKSNGGEFFSKMIADTVKHPASVVNESIQSYADKILSGNKAYNPLLWRIISYGNWLKCFDIK